MTPKSFSNIVRFILNLSFFKINSCPRTNLCKNRRMRSFSFPYFAIKRLLNQLQFYCFQLTSQECNFVGLLGSLGNLLDQTVLLYLSTNNNSGRDGVVYIRFSLNSTYLFGNNFIKREVNLFR